MALACHRCVRSDRRITCKLQDYKAQAYDNDIRIPNQNDRSRARMPRCPIQQSIDAPLFTAFLGSGGQSQGLFGSELFTFIFILISYMFEGPLELKPTEFRPETDVQRILFLKVAFFWVPIRKDHRRPCRRRS